MSYFIPKIDIRQLYKCFALPVTPFDCGEKCASHNPSGKPFCCDICQAVPAVYKLEWEFLQERTKLWHPWRGDECLQDLTDPDELRENTPDHMLLMACQGPEQCQREYRAISCRQFPFFPYVTSDYRFIGLAYEWEFETSCWVISNLGAVSEGYRKEFVCLYDELFAQWQEDFDGYALKSEEMREYFASQKRRIPILHRNGGFYLLSPRSERLRRVEPARLRRFGPYQG